MPSEIPVPAEREDEQSSVSVALDALAEALAHPGRRRLLAHLREAGETSIGALARRDEVAFDAADERAAVRRLRGIHLPKLEAADLVEYDYREGRVAPTATLDCLVAPVDACRTDVSPSE